jgi:hypothetical protein
LDDSGEIERFINGRGSLVIITSQLVHPNLSLPVDRIVLLRLCATFNHNSALADLHYTISFSVDVESFYIFVNAISGAPFDITDESITDLSSLAAEFGFIQVFSQIEARGPRFSAVRSAIWNREDIHQLIANLPEATPPDIQILHLNRSMQELGAH